MAASAAAAGMGDAFAAVPSVSVSFSGGFSGACGSGTGGGGSVTGGEETGGSVENTPRAVRPPVRMPRLDFGPLPGAGERKGGAFLSVWEGGRVRTREGFEGIRGEVGPGHRR